MKKTKFALSAIAMLFASHSFADNGKLIEINYTDEEGYGFYSVEPYDVDGNPAKTLGEARRNALQYAVNVLSTQFYSKQTITWNIAFTPEVDMIVNRLAYVEPMQNIEEDDGTHYFYNPKVEGDSNQYERNIYTLAHYLAHSDEGSRTNGESAIETFIPIEHTFNLNDIESQDSLFNFATDTFINAFGFSVTDNIHKAALEEEGADDPTEGSDDKALEFHLSYFDKFLVDSEGNSLYGMEFEDVVNAVNSGVYFSAYSDRTKAYLEDNAIIDTENDLGIPMISSSTFVIEDPAECELVEPVNDGDGTGEGDEDPEPECVEVEKDAYHANIDMTFSDSVAPLQQHSQSKPAVLDLGLSAHLLCDIGWCQTSATTDNPTYHGKVIDLAVNLTSEDGKFNINANKNADIKFEVSSVNNIYPIDSVVFEVAVSGEVTIDALNDPLLNSETCAITSVDTGDNKEVVSAHLVTCTFNKLEESEGFWLRLKSQEAGDYMISSRVYSDASNIDTYGLNNLNYQEISFYLNDSESDDSSEEDKSGGSFGFLSTLLMLPLVFLRRRRK